jgi:hypothetical protein
MALWCLLAGTGVQAKVSDAALTAIINDMKPLLRTQEYSTAVEQAVVEIGLALVGKSPQHSGDGDDSFVFWFFTAVVLAVCSCSFVSNWRKKTRFQVGASQLLLHLTTGVVLVLHVAGFCDEITLQQRVAEAHDRALDHAPL